ncbi:hypothetical protein Q8A67_007847 [Cirrhinus molitorella]|uniref:Uncharacterized protein n=1 Tax=Cirrhinus molitorella TaxID=172907 RepID=A0AA88PTC4_9TELE|nr:hypothetical protein Q8A67_007847 [Cirrhinus molitorella]
MYRTAAAASVLQCTGERHLDGKFHFNMSHDLKEDVNDCETQWVINGKVAGISEADGKTKFMPPLVMATANTAIINKKEQCSCDMTSATTLPEVGFPYWIVGTVIGVILLLCVIVTIVLYKKKKSRSGYHLGTSEETV